MYVEEFAVRIYSLCRKFNGSVTSWVRTAKRNSLVGGHPQSEHLVGLGADIVWDDPPALAEVQVVAVDLGLKVVRENDHDHIQPLERGK